MEVKGKGGWLGFLIFQLFATPLFILGTESSELFALQRQGFPISNGVIYKYLFSILIAGCPLFFAGYLLLTGTQRKDANEAVKYIWGGLAAIIFIPVIVLSSSFAHLPGVAGGTVLAVVRATVWGGIWSLYIHKSKRVRNTFPEAIKIHPNDSDGSRSGNSFNPQTLAENWRDTQDHQIDNTIPQSTECDAVSSSKLADQSLAGLKFTMFRANADGRWYWVLGLQSSDRIVARSFGFQSRSNCLDDIRQLRAGAASSQIWDKTANEFVV